jgi:hypothetical protein
LTPEQVIEFYRNNGYHFLAFTEHRVLTPGGVADDFALLSGIEVDGTDPSRDSTIWWGWWRREPTSLGRAATAAGVYRDRLRRAGSGAAAHPTGRDRCQRPAGLQGCFGLEVYNGGCDVDDAMISPPSTDDLLAAGWKSTGWQSMMPTGAAAARMPA